MALQPVNPGTKSMSAHILFRSYDYAIGLHLYHLADSEHAELVDLSTYNATSTFTIPTSSSSDSPTTQPTDVLDTSPSP